MLDTLDNSKMSDSGNSVSVVIPVYNVERYLERCMNTVLAQTVPFDEIILVDDGSTDKSGAMCDAYAEIYSQVRVVHKVNGGLSSARNAGIAVATSRYVSFIDSDDWVSDRYLEVLLRTISECEADIAMCGMTRLSDPSTVLGNVGGAKRTQVYSQDDFMRVMLRIDGNRTVHYAWGKLYDKRLLDEDHFPVGMLNEDVESCFKAILRASTIAETDEVLYCYFLNEESITGSSFGENYLSLTDVWQRVLELSAKEAPQWVEAVEFNLIRTDFTILCDSIIHGDKVSDLKYRGILKEHQARLRRNLPKLLRGPLPFNRKLFAIGLAVFYRPVVVVARLVR